MGALDALGGATAAAGVALATWALVSLGPARFFGTRAPQPSLLFRGPYRFVRHPCYLGVLIALLGLFTAARDLMAGATLVAAAVGIRIAVRREERQLLA